MRDLRFELEKDPPRDFSPFRLKPDAIESIATRNLEAVEWEEMMAAMPPSEPYGYLILEDSAGREVFNLTKDILVVGRSHDCDIVLPDRYVRVSKHHFEVRRNIDGITVADLGSRNGTFINDNPVKKPVKLKNGNILSIGGTSTREKSCVLRLELHGTISDDTTATEQGTRDFRQIES